eukprot:136290-Amphidinium_carterae.1
MQVCPQRCGRTGRDQPGFGTCADHPPRHPRPPPLAAYNGPTSPSRPLERLRLKDTKPLRA